MSGKLRKGSPGLICPPNSLFLLVQQEGMEEYKFETIWLADDRVHACMVTCDNSIL